MSRRFAVLAALTGLCMLPVSLAVAGQPDTQTHYRFLPRLSKLTENNEHDGFEVDYTVRGPFDFFVEHNVEIDPWGSKAGFTNVEAWAAHPILDFILPLDQVFNMSGLEGWQLPVLGPFDAYQFEGLNEQGAKVDLFATVIGPWFYLRGGTTPPEGSPELSTFTLNAIARSRPYADFDDSGVIDDLDLSRWQEYYGQRAPNSQDITHLGDADGDQHIAGGDFLIWQRQRGEMAPPAYVVPNFAIVPEPATWSLCVCLLTAPLLRRGEPGRCPNL